MSLDEHSASGTERDNSPSPQATTTSMSSQSSHPSYVYPLRSLLSGVQPAQQSDQVLSLSAIARYSNSVLRPPASDISSPSIERSPRDRSLFPTPVVGNKYQETSSQEGARDESASYASNSTKPGLVDQSLELQPERDVDKYNPGPPAFDSAAVAVISDTQSPLDFSKGSYVHLDSASSTPSSRVGSSKGSISGSFDASKRASRRTIAQKSDSTPAHLETGVEEPPGNFGGSGGGSSAVSIWSSQNSLATSNRGQLLSFRFQHVETESGHHVLTGREGKLLRCEDEPIRVPGAVQGFGVLIALEETEDGNLLVRQVSENSAEILGLSPRYLFSLDCFTSLLPDSQADLLWDNVQFLVDPAFDAEAGLDDSPQVFLLSGWGEPGSSLLDDTKGSESADSQTQKRRPWTCWCAIHRPSTPSSTQVDMGGGLSDEQGRRSGLVVLEFELEKDALNPLYPPFSAPNTNVSVASSPVLDNSGASDTSKVTLTSSEAHEPSSSQILTLEQIRAITHPVQGLIGDDNWLPPTEDVLESTVNHARPLRALERMRRMTRAAGSDGSSGQKGSKSRTRRAQQEEGVGTMDIFTVLAQVNEQLAAANDLQSFLKIVVGIIKDLTQFHRVLIYQFDEHWNGQVVAELVDWSQTRDLYNSLHFPASDIPAQARELYTINKVRLLYNRSQPTARLVVRSRVDLATPLDMTHSFLRAMSPIHVKYLGNMGVRASMSISIVTFGALWGLIACHSYGDAGMRVSFPVRQMLRLLSDSISRNIERLSYAQRLHTRKLISTLPTDQHPKGYIVTNAEDLLGLFDADFGVLVVGDGAKILGPNQHGQEILIVSEYLRLKQFKLMQVSQSVAKDFPDLQLLNGMDVIAGLLYVPLTSAGKDFIVFLRKGQLREVHWAGKPFKDNQEGRATLEPRKSFKVWSETVSGRCRAWTDEQLETAGVLSLVYGKFIEVWREKERALQTNQLTSLLLSNASHEVRTPLNHIINYLEMALNGPLDSETRENLVRSHTASKGLLFTINDLLDLTRLESGNETSFNEPFDMRNAIREAVHLYSLEARRRNIEFKLDIDSAPDIVIGDARKIRTIVANLTANAVKFTSSGSISLECRQFQEPRGLRRAKEVVVEIVVADTGCGIPNEMLARIFRDFEQVETTEPDLMEVPEAKLKSASAGLGLGLAVVARIVEQLGGQLRVDSKPDEGSRFSFLIPFSTSREGATSDARLLSSGNSSKSYVEESRSRTDSDGSAGSEIESLVEALGSSHMQPGGKSSGLRRRSVKKTVQAPRDGKFEVDGSNFPVRSLKLDEFDIDKQAPNPSGSFQDSISQTTGRDAPGRFVQTPTPSTSKSSSRLRILVVEDDKMNSAVLCKRLKLDGHDVDAASNGQEGVEMIEKDQEFDAVLMDIQMPILNGFEATERIRMLESDTKTREEQRRSSHRLNGRLPIFAVSASLRENQRQNMLRLGMDGWILKPIDFKRLRNILAGITDPSQRSKVVYHVGCNWEQGGWLHQSNDKLDGGDFSNDT